MWKERKGSGLPGRGGVRRCAIMASLLVLAGCASGTGIRRADSGTTAIVGEAGPGMVVETFTPVETTEHVVAATEPEIWPLLPAVFDDLGIEVTEVKEAQFILGNPRFRPRRIDGERLSTFLECGRDHGGAYADQHEVWVTVMVQLLRAPDGRTRVTALVNGSAQPRNVTGNALPCDSKLTLEARIAELIRERLSGPGAIRT